MIKKAQLCRLNTGNNPTICNYGFDLTMYNSDSPFFFNKTNKINGILIIPEMIITNRVKVYPYE